MPWRASNSLTRPFQSCKISCHGRVQAIPAGGPTTLRSNFRNKTSNLRRSVLYIVRCPAAKTATGETTASKYQASCLNDASGRNFALEFATGKMSVQTFHLVGSKAKCASPSDLREIEERNLHISNTRKNISLTISCNHGILTVWDQGLSQQIRVDILGVNQKMLCGVSCCQVPALCWVLGRKSLQRFGFSEPRALRDHNFITFYCN